MPVRGEVSGRIHTVASAPVVDLSEGGALLEVPCVLRPRSLYTFRLSLGEGKVLVLQSSVVRSYVHSVQPIGEGESRVQYRAAIQFTNLGDADRDLLRLRLYGSTEETDDEATALHDQTPEVLLADLLTAEPHAGTAPSVLDTLTALLEENEPFGVEPERRAAASPPEPLPPLPDVEPLPPLPEIEPWPSTLPALAPQAPELPSAPAPVEEVPPTAETDAGTEMAPQAELVPAEVEREPETERLEPAEEPARMLAQAAAENAPEAPPPTLPVEEQPAQTPARPMAPEAQPPPAAPHPSAWQRLKGWITSKPAAERTGGTSILGLGIEVPPPKSEKPPVVEERRGFARVVVEGSVSGEMGLVMRTDVDALSVGGLMARLPFAPETGSTLSFTIEIDERPIVVEGTVRNVQEIRVGGDVEYQVGLEFGPLDEPVRAAIKDYVDRRLEEEKSEYTPVD